MTRIAVIGNSHIGAMKLAWRQIAEERPELTARFFASYGEMYLKCRLSEDHQYGALDPERFTEAELESLRQLNRRLALDLGSFDLVVNVGWPGFQIHELPGLVDKADIEGLSDRGEGPLISAPCFEAFLSDLVQGALPGAFWRDWPKGNLVMVAPPRYAESVFQRRAAKTPPDPAPQRAAKARHDALLAEAFAGIGARYVAQPDETLADNGLTQIRFNRGAVGASVNRSRDDPTHMNEDYGVLQWRRILAPLP